MCLFICFNFLSNLQDATAECSCNCIEKHKCFISSFVFIAITFPCVVLDDHLLQRVTIYYFRLKIIFALTDIF